MADEEPFCVEGCGRTAVGERLLGVTADGDEIVELVCYECSLPDD